VRFFIGAKMAIYERDELEEKIRKLDEKIENAQSQVSFNGRSVSYQVSEWTKQRDRYQQMLNELLAETRQRVKRHRIKYARF
jgi:hypothetical protein